MVRGRLSQASAVHTPTRTSTGRSWQHASRRLALSALCSSAPSRNGGRASLWSSNLPLFVSEGLDPTIFATDAKMRARKFQNLTYVSVTPSLCRPQGCRAPGWKRAHRVRLWSPHAARVACGRADRAVRAGNSGAAGEALISSRPTLLRRACRWGPLAAWPCHRDRRNRLATSSCEV